MKIKRIVVGELKENCYILEKNGQALLIDPGGGGNGCERSIDFLKIQKAIGNLQILKILITHHHFDHVGSLSDCIRTYHVEKIDASSMQNKSCSIGPFTFRIISTPGHTSDSISFYFEEEKVMFVGDFVFQGTIGRCDLPTGNFSEMLDSIQKLKNYKEDIILYPGHGEPTTIQEEKLKNPYFR